MPQIAGQQPKVVQVMNSFHDAVLLRETEQAERMARTWMSVEAEIQQLLLEVSYLLQDAKARGAAVTQQLLWDQERWVSLLDQVQNQILGFARDKALPDIMAEQAAYAELGITGAQAGIMASGGGDAILGQAFTQLPIDALQHLVGLAGDGSPLYDLLADSYPLAVDGITDALIKGVALGYGPPQVAKMMAEGMSDSLDRMLLIARTEQLRMWRTASVAQYRASSVVSSFRRLATKDDRTCMACLVSDGELIPINEELTDHPRGRCTTVPNVIGAPPITWQYGQDWFLQQSEETQRKMMGNAMYELWKQEKFPLSALRTDRINHIWGNSPQTITFRGLQAGQGGIPRDLPPEERRRLLDEKNARARARRARRAAEGQKQGDVPLPLREDEILPMPKTRVAGGERRYTGLPPIKDDFQRFGPYDIKLAPANYRPGCFDSMPVIVRDPATGREWKAMLKTNWETKYGPWGDYHLDRGFAQREVLASDVSELLGLDIVPHTDGFEWAGEKFSLQSWIPGRAAVGGSRESWMANWKAADKSEQGKMGLLDIILGNRDRHGSNWMVNDQGHLFAIDNGLTFVEKRFGEARDFWWSRGKLPGLAGSNTVSDTLRDGWNMWKPAGSTVQSQGVYLPRVFKDTLQKAYDSGELTTVLNGSIVTDTADFKYGTEKLVDYALRRVRDLLNNWDKFFWDETSEGLVR